MDLARREALLALEVQPFFDAAFLLRDSAITLVCLKGRVIRRLPHTSQSALLLLQPSLLHDIRVAITPSFDFPAHNFVGCQSPTQCHSMSDVNDILWKRRRGQRSLCMRSLEGAVVSEVHRDLWGKGAYSLGSGIFSVFLEGKVWEERCEFHTCDKMRALRFAYAVIQSL